MAEDINNQDEFVLDETLNLPSEQEVAEQELAVSEWGSEYDTPGERNIFEVAIDAYDEYVDNYKASDRRDLDSRISDELRIRKSESDDPFLISPEDAKRLYGFKIGKPMARGRLDLMKEIREEQEELDNELGKNYDRWDRSWIEGAAGLLGGFIGGISKTELAADYVITAGIGAAAPITLLGAFGKALYKGHKVSKATQIAKRAVLLSRAANRMKRTTKLTMLADDARKTSHVQRMADLVYSPKVKELATAGGINVAIERANFALGKYHGDDRVFTAQDFAFAFFAPAAFSGLIKTGTWGFNKLTRYAGKLDTKIRTKLDKPKLIDDGDFDGQPISRRAKAEAEYSAKSDERADDVIRQLEEAEGRKVSDTDVTEYSRDIARENYDVKLNDLNDVIDDLDSFADSEHALKGLEATKARYAKAGQDTSALDTLIEQYQAKVEIDKTLGAENVEAYLKNQISLMTELDMTPNLSGLYQFLKSADAFKARIDELRVEGRLPEGDLRNLDDADLDTIFSVKASDYAEFVNNPANIVPDKPKIGKRQVKAPDDPKPEQSLDDTLAAAKAVGKDDVRVGAFADKIDSYKKALKDYIACKVGG